MEPVNPQAELDAALKRISELKEQQAELDAASKRIAELKEQLDGYVKLTFAAGVAMREPLKKVMALEKRIAELEGLEALELKLKAHADLTMESGRAMGMQLMKVQALEKRILVMAEILDRVPHEYLDDQPPDKPLRCWTDCPACDWAKLK